MKDPVTHESSGEFEGEGSESQGFSVGSALVKVGVGVRDCREADALLWEALCCDYCTDM